MAQIHWKNGSPGICLRAGEDIRNNDCKKRCTDTEAHREDGHTRSILAAVIDYFGKAYRQSEVEY